MIFLSSPATLCLRGQQPVGQAREAQLANERDQPSHDM
jgi:hypothetical protein